MAEIIAKKDAEIDSDDEEELVAQEEAKVEEVEEDTSLANSDVTTKYQEAAKITQAALIYVSEMCVPGAKIVDLCRAGDAFIEKSASVIFNKKTKAGNLITKGVAFPVCVSVNECVCHCSPLESDDSYAALKVDDMVKIDLGSHVDGYIVVAAHTVIVKDASSAASEIVTGPR